MGITSILNIMPGVKASRHGRVTLPPMTLHVCSNFDAGNIEVESAQDPGAIELRLRKDAGDEHMQWFYFRVSGVRDVALRWTITNAGQASYPAGWEGYRAVASYDRDEWFRVPTSYANGRLTVEHTPERDAVWYAYFAPYSIERHHDLIATASCSTLVRHEVAGHSVDGQDIDLLHISDETLGDAAGKKSCWIIGRQHPGESMAEWLIEGLLDRLLDDNDSVARELLRRADFHVVPNMNPDGSRRGHLRTNASGANLNREWQSPSHDKSPEVLCIRERMQRDGLHFCLDVHGDEGLPYNFIAGPDGVEGLPGKLAELQDAYERRLMQVNPDFQITHGYPEAAPGTANMTMCTTWVADHFKALAMTLEQPFKDTADSPHVAHGWSPERCRQLGRSNLDALLHVIDSL